MDHTSYHLYESIIFFITYRNKNRKKVLPGDVYLRLLCGEYDDLRVNFHNLGGRGGELYHFGMIHG